VMTSISKTDFSPKIYIRIKCERGPKGSRRPNEKQKIPKLVVGEETEKKKKKKHETHRSSLLRDVKEGTTRLKALPGPKETLSWQLVDKTPSK